ncbi:MAG: hypothetical protein RL259_683 [Bacteroidota bacterium]|jgi:transglutaminase-like putative cysteine protease
MQKIFVVFFTILFLQSVSSQKLKLGEVTIDELKQAVHPKDSSANAAYLFKIGKTQFNIDREGSWEIVTQVNVKIKIYKKEGLGQANQEIAYYVGGISKERIYIDQAFTYNLVGNKIEKTRLKSEGEFKEEVNEKWTVKKITFPSVKEGSIIEFSYKLVSPFISNFNDWHFQSKIPVNFVQYDVYIPQYFRYRTVITGYETIKTEEKSIPGTDFNSLKYTYSANDLEPIKEEEFVKNIDNYSSILKYELASIQYPNQPSKDVALNWEDVSKSIYENESFGRELDHKSYFEEELKPLIANLSNENEKLIKIFEFVQSRMNWNNKKGYNCELGVKKAFKDRVGNSADINLMLVSMLRYSGIDANPVVISTRSNGIAIFPSRFAFNFVLAGVKLKNTENIILLDATNKYTLPDLIPLETLNWYGRMLLRNGTSVEIPLEPKKQSNKTIVVLAEVEDEVNIKGKAREGLSEYYALLFKENYEALDENSIIEKYENKYQGTEIEDLVIKKEKGKPINLTYSFLKNNAIEIIGEKLYLTPLLFYGMDENPFKSEKRKYPIEFDFQQKLNFNISIKIPENYDVESFPTPIVLKSSNNSFLFNFNGTVTNGMIQIVSSFEINSLLFSAEDYENIKSYFKEIISKQTEKIVLIKKKL